MELKSRRCNLCMLSTKYVRWSEVKPFQPDSVMPARFGQPLDNLARKQFMSDIFQLARRMWPLDYITKLCLLNLQTFSSVQALQRLSTNHLSFNSVRYFSLTHVVRSMVRHSVGLRETCRQSEQTLPRRKRVGKQPCVSTACSKIWGNNKSKLVMGFILLL